MRYLILLLTFIFTNNLIASEWAVSGLEGNKVFLDKESISHNKNIVKVWTKSIFPPNKLFDGKEYNQSKFLLKFNCLNHTVAILQDFLYMNNELVEMNNYSKKNIIFTDVIPDSVGDSTYKFVCQSKAE